MRLIQTPDEHVEYLDARDALDNLRNQRCARQPFVYSDFLVNMNAEKKFIEGCTLVNSHKEFKIN